MKKFIAFLCAALLLLTWAAAEENDDSEIIEEEVLLDDYGNEILITPEPETGGEPASDGVFTPSSGSRYAPLPGENNYWTLPMDITDEAAVWEMLMQPITVVDIGKKSGEKSKAFLYREPDESSLKIGEVTCESQGVRVIETLEDGWSLVECYSSSFHDTDIGAWNLLVSGYIRTDYLKQVTPNPEMGIVVDKLSQRLYVFQDGKLLTTLLCSTGLTQWNGSKYQPYNETRSGEFLLMNKLGAFQSDRLICSYAIRFNNGDAVHEVPHVNNKDGTPNYGTTEHKLGTKCSHGCIRVQRNRTPEGINMKWIYNQLKSGSKVKFVVWEDWQGRQLSVPDADTPLYYNPGKGSYYHRSSFCYSAKAVTFQPFTYGQLEEEPFSKLEPCEFCVPPLRESAIASINETYAPGGDHNELLTSLQQPYFDYLAAN